MKKEAIEKLEDIICHWRYTAQIDSALASMIYDAGYRPPAETDKGLREQIAKTIYDNIYPDGWFNNTWLELDRNDPKQKEKVRKLADQILALLQSSQSIEDAKREVAGDIELGIRKIYGGGFGCQGSYNASSPDCQAPCTQRRECQILQFIKSKYGR